WHDWSEEEDGWSGYVSTWDVTAYNSYATAAKAAQYDEATFDPLIGYDPSKGGETPYPVAMTFSGTPEKSEAGIYEILVTAADESGASISDVFTLTVTDREYGESEGDDTLTGDRNDNVIFGSAGNDRISGNDGDDILVGGTGDDLMVGGRGNDTYYVDSEGDVVRESNSAFGGFFSFFGNRSGGTDTVKSEVDRELGTGIENLELLGSADLDGTGNMLDNELVGNEGDNRLEGLSGDDRLIGNGGDDILDGGWGNDVLIGGAGADRLIGGSGRDIFRYDSETESGLTAETMDVITDFRSRQDRLDLSGMDANNTIAGDQAFSRIILGSSDAFSGAGQLRFDSASGILYGNTDSDADAEFAIRLSGVNSLRSSDIVL
ncbi:calcium-binding protein, partial [Chlorobium limicola]